MKKWFLISVILIGIISCQEVEFAQKPKTVISEDQMVEIITDLALYDAAHSVNEYQLRKFDKDINQFLISKYNVDSTLLSQNIAYYNEKYDENLNIYKRVGERIDAKREYFDSIKKISDSIKREKIEKRREDAKLKADRKR